MSQTQNTNDARFLHFRYTDLDGTWYARGGLTIAYRETPEGIEYADAKCHLNDNFVKAQGRAKAAGRLASTKLRKTVKGVSEREFVDDVAAEVAMFGLSRKYNGRRKPKALTASEAGLIGN